MDLKQLLNDDDAVSPVIGVILMVAITVILAAVIASFVLGLGDQAQNPTPQASFDFDYDSTNDNLDITHDGGDSIDSARLSLGGDASGTPWSGTVDAGTTVTYDTSGNSAGDTVSVIWTDADEETSSTLASYEIP